jgi:hypothetical protein
MDFTSFIIAFLSGVLFHVVWNALINMGYTIIMMKSAMKDCVMFMAKNLQNVYEIKYLKEEAMRLAGRDEKYIEWQRKIDEKEIRSLKTTCIRNFINALPPKYNHLIKFHDWDSAMEYLNNANKEVR